MSVMVEIVIADGAARRGLIIENVSDAIELDQDGNRSLDQQCEYVVRCVNGGSRTIESRFTHRFGDDVIVLIARAGDALRDDHGVI